MFLINYIVGVVSKSSLLDKIRFVLACILALIMLHFFMFTQGVLMGFPLAFITMLGLICLDAMWIQLLRTIGRTIASLRSLKGKDIY